MVVVGAAVMDSIASVNQHTQAYINKYTDTDMHFDRYSQTHQVY